MPYRSKAQQRLFHAKEARGEISPQVVSEFDQATKGHYAELPQQVSKRGKKPVRRGKIMQGSTDD